MSDTTSIDILVNEPTGTISPMLHGHFMEHLGGCIEEGCWVGLDSRIPNTGGVRNDVVEALKALNPPIMRWPGGCFADDYDWRDGIGPMESRPRTVNIHWGDAIETNQFGTHEFMAFCKAIGADPYFCGNMGSGSPKLMRDWVEYCNLPSGSTLTDKRSANGSEEPFGIRYWGVGNENWGCGGGFTPEDYGAEYRRFSTYMHNFGGTRLQLIACGPNGNDLDWTRRFFSKLKKDYGEAASPWGYSAHYYCGTTGSATEYTEAQWLELLWKATLMEPMIVQQRALLDSFDPKREINLIVDEWGTWHTFDPAAKPSFILYQQNTVRDALVAAITLDIFHRHADKVAMANIAQTINVLQSLIITDGERMIKTPTYHVFDLYQPHKGGQSLRTLINTPELDVVCNNRPERLPALTGSASIKENVVTLTVVNSSANRVYETSLRLLGGGHPTKMEIASLNYPDGGIKAHNTMDHPNTVNLKREKKSRELNGSDPTYQFPPASVTRLTLHLG